MRIDDSLKLAGQLLAAHMQQTEVPAKRIAGLLHELHQDVVRIQSGAYSAWQDELPDLDVLDQAELDRITPRTYPPPQHPLADPETSIESKIAGTVGPDSITCLECGKEVKLMKSHLLTSHNRMGWEEYLDRHGLPKDYPATPSAYSELKRQQVTARARGEQEEDGD